MNLFNKEPKWLSTLAYKKIEEDHEELHISRRTSNLNKVYRLMTAKESYKIIVPFTFIYFTLSCLIHKFNFIKIINIDLETVKILVDQRTGNISGITALTLVVAGFLINNLALKEHLTYRLLFLYSYLYPTVYLTLSIIGAFFIISTLRDTISEAIFSNLVLAGTYLSLIILILIGILFNRIINFTSIYKVNQIIEKELLKETKLNIRDQLFFKYSNEIYLYKLQNINVREAELYEYPSFNNNPNTSSTEIHGYISDINMVRIKEFCERKLAKELCHRRISLNQLYTGELDFIFWPNTFNDKAERTFLNKSLKIKSKSFIPDKTYRKFIDNNFTKALNNSDHDSISNYLELYKIIYELQTKHQ